MTARRLFSGPWVRFVCDCGYSRETLDRGEQATPCALCGRAVRAERIRSDDGETEA